MLQQNKYFTESISNIRMQNKNLVVHQVRNTHSWIYIFFPLWFLSSQVQALHYKITKLWKKHIQNVVSNLDPTPKYL